MNYSQSTKILQKIKKANAIVLNCHRGPDADTTASALALYQVLSTMNKKVSIICPDPVEEALFFLPHSKEIQVIDYKTFDFSSFDLFITQDSSSEDVITGEKEIPLPSLPLINIDHHRTNKEFGEINLVDPTAAANAQILFKILEDWDVEITMEIATCLLTGIIGDTGAFQYPDTSAETMTIGGKLMEKGANRDEIIFHLYRQQTAERVQLVGEILRALQLDEVHKFAWSATPYDTYIKYGDKNAKGVAASLFMQNIKDTNFGVIITGGDNGEIWVNLRSRIPSFDVSKIAAELGGGGHKLAAGATIKGVAFEEAKETILAICRKYSKQ